MSIPNIILNAIIKNDSNTLDYFLKSYKNVDCIKNTEDKTALLVGLDHKNPVIIEQILNSGADPNLYLSRHTTPLGYFIKTLYKKTTLNYIEIRIILILLRHGANPDIMINGLISPREMLYYFKYEINGIYLTIKSIPNRSDDDNIESSDYAKMISTEYNESIYSSIVMDD